MTGKPQTPVSRAKIFMTDGIDTITYSENANSPGLYQTPNSCFGIGGHTYTLKISKVDIDSDGNYEEYTAQTMMPVPVRFDSMLSYYGMNGDSIEGTVMSFGHYTTFYNGPDYLFDTLIVNNKGIFPLTDQFQFGAGMFTRDESGYKTEKVSTPGSAAQGWTGGAIERLKVNKGDTIRIVGLNFNKDQYEFLKEFDNNATSGNLIEDNLYDQLRIPANLPTNIQPSDKAAGYFFIYSISRISKVFEESK